MAGGTGKLGTFSALSIGIGGMVGGGIFAVTGLTIDLTHGAATLAFLIAGIVALLTGYCYLKLSLVFPGEGGTVDFLNRAFGDGILTGGANILLLQSYVVLIAVYAYAFGSYGADLVPGGDPVVWRHLLASAVILGLLALNVLAARAVMKSENLFNALKLVLLGGFIVAGFATPMEWARLDPAGAVAPLALVSGAMLIFLNYEGFELIANASRDVAHPRRALPIAYLGGIALVILLYVLIVAVVLGHLTLDEIHADRDTALSAAGRQILGRPGHLAIVAAALLATSSAINATFYSTGRLAYVVAKTGELPRELERSIRGEHAEGSVICAFFALAIVNLVPLEAIATMGSAGFLVIFALVNLAALRLSPQTGSGRLVPAIAALATLGALAVLCADVADNRATRGQIWILAGMIGSSLAIEAVYRGLTGRRIRLRRAAG